MLALQKLPCHWLYNARELELEWEGSRRGTAEEEKEEIRGDRPASATFVVLFSLGAWVADKIFFFSCAL